MRITKILLAAVLAAPLAGCGDAGTGTAETDDPINIASVSTLSGPVTFPESSLAARAVFDDVNDKGGINGRKIVYTMADDKGDPAGAALAGRDVIERKQAVALAGGASLLDCQVNGAVYARAKITDVRGVGVDPGCFSSANISPVNTGPFFGSTVTLYYASETLKLNKLCVFLSIIGGTAEAYKEGVARWSRLTGKKPLIMDLSLATAPSNFTPYILRARNAGCEAVLFNGVEPELIGWVKAAQKQNVTDIKWLFLAPAYTEEVGKALGSSGRSVIALSEFEPYTESASRANREWRTTMEEHKVPLTAFAQGGYLAAKHLVTVLRSIKGDITRESVTEAMKTLRPLPSAMTGTPFAFGPGDAHASNLAAKFVQPDGQGGWAVLTSDWIKLPNG
ncbi:ABC transporter substrate-binding protein [Actinomadura decatromicini]|uniref:ABC transporter substrate-binding protein n=1 Tax=Actinomadura decatromicini TaxID=2604572 RepID=A0A5D3FW87_9ACTN|nr:ABC transporter substrate-binding protein [Actinomadura decatromicini]TYK52298.1 ABC transporter substrate-binding protein [Actinomadura decatromicini]